MIKQNPQHPVRKDIENTADYEDDLNSGKEYSDQIKRRLDFKHSVDYADTPSVIKETHATDPTILKCLIVDFQSMKIKESYYM